MMKSISVVIATHNRATILRETLEAMTSVDFRGIQVEWVVINNSCSDETDAVLLSFQERLPLRRLYEPIAGKNRALNRALSESCLGDIIIFSDDDVQPSSCWLHEILVASDRWPDHSVFGGRVMPMWPSGGPPNWLEQPFLRAIAFSSHDLGQIEMPYPRGTYPFGPNFWVRKSVFSTGRQFAEHIGPIATRRIMGSETSFLKALEDDGYEMIYVPNVSLYHRIKSHDCDFEVIAKRASSYGRGRAWIDGIDYDGLLTNHSIWWRSRQGLKAVRAFAKLCIGHFRVGKIKRREYMLLQYIELGRLGESLRIAKMSARRSP